MTDIQNIRERAQIVKNATQIGENTAERVGGILVDSIDTIAEQATELLKKANKTDIANSLVEVNNAIAAKADAAATTKSISDINAELLKKANKTDLDKHENAYTGDYLAVSDFADDESVSQLTGNDRYQAIRNLGNAWLDNITFNMDTDVRYIGRCKLGWDGVNIECYNYVCSWADHIGVQQLTGAIRIGDDGKAEIGTVQNVLFRTYQDGVWGAWQSYNAENLSDPTRQIESINTAELDACKDDFANIWWRAKRPVMYRLMLTQRNYTQCVGTLLMWADGSTTWLHQVVIGSFGVNTDGSPSWTTGSGLRTFRIFHRGFIRDNEDWDKWQEVGGTGVVGRLDALYTGFENMSKAITPILKSEEERVSAEQQRASAEQGRAKAEQQREDSETARKTAEEQRQTAETSRNTAFSRMQTDTETAVRNCRTATEGAEKVNATVSGTVLSVTSRDGEVTSSDVRGPKGDKGTFAELTESEKDELKKPAKDAADELNGYLDIVKLPVVSTSVGGTSVAMDANKVYDITIGTELTITLNDAADLTVTNEWQGSFDTGAEAPTVTWPADVVWADEPSVEANAHHEFSVRLSRGKYYGILTKWEN